METILYPKRIQSPGRIAGGLLCIIAGLTFPIESGLVRLLAVAGGIGWLMPGFGSLKLNENGFTFRSVFSEKTTPWTDIDSFFVVTQRILHLIPINRMVGWKFTKAKRPTVLKVTSLLVPYDALLPNTYGMKASELAALLEAWRVRVTANQQTAYEPKAFRI